MNGYIMFGKQLQCHIVEEANKDTFKHGNRDWKFVPKQLKFRNEKNREKSSVEKAAKVTGLLEKEKEKRNRLKELGISYDFSGYVSLLPRV
jgi:nucleolar protein 15